MNINRFAPVAAAMAITLLAAQPVSAQQELIYGNWTPPQVVKQP